MAGGVGAVDDEVFSVVRRFAPEFVKDLHHVHHVADARALMYLHLFIG